MTTNKLSSFVLLHLAILSLPPRAGLGQDLTGQSTPSPAFTMATQPWHTFLGTGLDDEARAVATDESGNIYIIGSSLASWGSPARVFSGPEFEGATACNDVFVAKVTPAGAVVWNTFLGSAKDDKGLGITVATDGDVYVTGWSLKTWGDPIRPFDGGFEDAFVARLAAGDGTLRWHTFLGGGNLDEGNGITAGAGNTVLVTGESWTSWGSPVQAASGIDAFVACLESGTGILVWNTFLGGSGNDSARAITQRSGSAYVIGNSKVSWGQPMHHFMTNYDALHPTTDAFVAKLDATTGTQGWNTFLGSLENDEGSAITADDKGNLYVTGKSAATWGKPVTDHEGSLDVFAARLNVDTGALAWNTFAGSSLNDSGHAIALQGDALYLAGESFWPWGTSANAFAGDRDGFVARLDAGTGIAGDNTFLGGTGKDYAFGLAIDPSGTVIAAGSGTASWGSPLNAFAGGTDAFLAQIPALAAPILPLPSLLETANILKALTHQSLAEGQTAPAQDIDGDSRIGLREAISILRQIFAPH